MASPSLYLRSIIRSEPLTKSFLRPFSTLPLLYAPQTGSKGNKEKAAKEKAKKKRKKYTVYKQHDLREAEQFALCDAIRSAGPNALFHHPQTNHRFRYIRAFEVGRPPTVPKYECHIRMRTKKSGPVIRSQMRLPHSVKTDIKICVICPPDSPAATQAKAAGAVLVGEDEVFEVIKSGKFDFDRCIALPASLPKMNQAGLGRILGPRGLMPSAKLGTVVENVGSAMRNMLGGSMYSERQGVVRMAVGQLGFTPEQLRDNLKAFVGQITKDAQALSDQVTKQVHEVVSSSTSLWSCMEER